VLLVNIEGYTNSIILNEPLGIGKSYFLDMITDKKYLHLVTDKELHEQLSNAIPLKITFTEDMDNVVLGVALLLSYVTFPLFFFMITLFGRYFNIEKKTLISKLKDRPFLDPEDAIEIIKEHSGGKPIILVVDEMMKLGKDKARSVLSGIGKLLDAFGDLHCVISTLDFLYFQEHASESGRQFDWVPLSPPTFKECCELFELTEGQYYDPIGQCIMECNGHLRNMEDLKDIWNAPGNHELQHKELMALLVKRVKVGIPLPDNAVILALSGEVVDRSTKVGDHTIGKLIATGWLHN
jgi:hypothetical protein